MYTPDSLISSFQDGSVHYYTEMPSFNPPRQDITYYSARSLGKGSEL